jgi:anti-anti-sigma regulatory factor
MIFPADACLPGAADLRERMLGAFDAQTAIAIDLTPVERVDLSLLQLVNAARTEAGRRGIDLTLAAPAPAAVRTCLDRAGFTASFTPQDHQFWFHGDPCA